MKSFFHPVRPVTASFTRVPLSCLLWGALHRAAASFTRVSLSCLLWGALLLSAVSCQRRSYELFTGYAQGGTWSVKADMNGVKSPHQDVAAALDSIFTLVDTTLSGYNRGSILSRRNALASSPSGSEASAVVPTNAVFDEILAFSDSVREISGGAFDVAGAPLFDVWGFGFTADSLPSREFLDSALELCRARKKLNFNAVAQGFTCDLISRYLHSIGVTSMLVEVGEIYCEGLNPSGRGWTIGIDTPFDGNNSPGRSISGVWESDGRPFGVVTSGNYRKYYIRDGHKYAHTIDPRTGLPVSHRLLSATVTVSIPGCATPAALADALATYYMVVGGEEARAHILSTEGVEACLISGDSLWTSPGFLLKRQAQRFSD